MILNDDKEDNKPRLQLVCVTKTLCSIHENLEFKASHCTWKLRDSLVVTHENHCEFFYFANISLIRFLLSNHLITYVNFFFQFSCYNGWSWTYCIDVNFSHWCKFHQMSGNYMRHNWLVCFVVPPFRIFILHFVINIVRILCLLKRSRFE